MDWFLKQEINQNPARICCYESYVGSQQLPERNHKYCPFAKPEPVLAGMLIGNIGSSLSMLVAGFVKNVDQVPVKYHPFSIGCRMLLWNLVPLEFIFFALRTIPFHWLR